MYFWLFTIICMAVFAIGVLVCSETKHETLGITCAVVSAVVFLLGVIVTNLPATIVEVENQEYQSYDLAEIPALSAQEPIYAIRSANEYVFFYYKDGDIMPSAYYSGVSETTINYVSGGPFKPYVETYEEATGTEHQFWFLKRRSAVFEWRTRYVLTIPEGALVNFTDLG